LNQETETADNDADAGLPTAVISLRIMEMLAATDEEFGITNLAQALGMPKARVHRHLSSLKSHGYVTQNPATNRYSIGWRLYLLGQNLVKRFPVVSLSRKIREELRDKVGLTVVITTHANDHVIVLDFLLGNSPLEIMLRAGSRFNLNAAAQGKVVLAFGSPVLLEQTLNGNLKPDTSHTITDPARLQTRNRKSKKNREWADGSRRIVFGRERDLPPPSSSKTAVCSVHSRWSDRFIICRHNPPRKQSTRCCLRLPIFPRCWDMARCRSQADTE